MSKSKAAKEAKRARKAADRAQLEALVLGQIERLHNRIIELETAQAIVRGCLAQPEHDEPTSFTHHVTGNVPT